MSTILARAPLVGTPVPITPHWSQERRALALCALCGSLRRDVILGGGRMQVVAVLGDTVVTIVNIKLHSNFACNLAFIEPRSA